MERYVFKLQATRKTGNCFLNAIGSQWFDGLMWEGVKDFRHVSEVSKNRKQKKKVVRDPKNLSGTEWVKAMTQKPS